MPEIALRLAMARVIMRDLAGLVMRQIPGLQIPTPLALPVIGRLVLLRRIAVLRVELLLSTVRGKGVVRLRLRLAIGAGIGVGIRQPGISLMLGLRRKPLEVRCELTVRPRCIRRIGVDRLLEGVSHLWVVRRMRLRMVRCGVVAAVASVSLAGVVGVERRGLRVAAALRGVTVMPLRIAALLGLLLMPTLQLGAGLLVALGGPLWRVSASLCRRAVRPSHVLPPHRVQPRPIRSYYRISCGASTPRTSSPDAITCAQAWTIASLAKVKSGSSARIKRKCGESVPRVQCPWNSEAKSYK